MGKLLDILATAAQAMVKISAGSIQGSEIAKQIHSFQTELQEIKNIANDSQTISLMKVTAKQFNGVIINSKVNQRNITDTERMFISYSRYFLSFLNPNSRTVEKGIFLGSIISQLDIIDRDLTLIANNIKTILIIDSPEQMKVTQAYVFGYLKLAQQTVDYLTGATFMLNLPENSAAPLYHVRNLDRIGQSVADFVNHLVSRGSGTIIDTINRIKQQQADIILSDGEQAISNYGNDVDYALNRTGVANFVGVTSRGLTLNPFLIFGNLAIKIAEAKNQRRLLDREWYAIKIKLLALEMAKQDQNSPEYLELKKRLDFYTNKIAEVDRKIEDYYNS